MVVLHLLLLDTYNLDSQCLSLLLKIIGFVQTFCINIPNKITVIHFKHGLSKL